ncbi:excinuclease ABC subunit UvrB [Candidatus Woesearchaeota archaeon]|nr:excinuclease ABC subunit UvrB [Candidatus Woesearchaeota archaeon]
MRKTGSFELVTDLVPKGSQPKAIKLLVDGLKKHSHQTLLGITGSGKTFTMANVIAQVNKPTLILAHNKTLAAQLYNELKELFPNNAVEYFVSYYDYYQPESYLPTTDTYIEKDAKVNEKIEQLRLRATTSLLTRNDVVIVASVSSIYGLGSPATFEDLSFSITKGEKLSRQQLLKKLLDIQYERNDTALQNGRFRVRGDVVDIFGGFEEHLVRVEFFGDVVESITLRENVSFKKLELLNSIDVFPARHYVITEQQKEMALDSIKKELEEHAPTLEPLERHRLTTRTKYDLEMLENVGFCSGIENYSRHFENRKSGEPPYCLLDFFGDDFLFFIDESHVSIPQVHGMYKGDYSRKKNLIDFGFRLPSAYDNRPLKFAEFEKYLKHVVFVSATPADWELKGSGQVVEQIIRPTGLLDPQVIVKPTKGQVNDLISEIKKTVKNGFRVLVTTLTKRMAEDLADYLAKANIKTRYMHSEIDTIERSEIIRELRIGSFDVLVGINLLREGLDIPEVSLVAIMDADKEGFLRTDRSLIQTIGRAARNSDGHVFMYADKITDSMKRAISVTHERRAKQIMFNKKQGITPKTIIKKIPEKLVEVSDVKSIPKSSIPQVVEELEAQMNLAAENLDFERAIQLRDRINELKNRS